MAKVFPMLVCSAQCEKRMWRKKSFCGVERMWSVNKEKDTLRLRLSPWPSHSLIFDTSENYQQPLHILSSFTKSLNLKLVILNSWGKMKANKKNCFLEKYNGWSSVGWGLCGCFGMCSVNIIWLIELWHDEWWINFNLLLPLNYWSTVYLTT